MAAVTFEMLRGLKVLVVEDEYLIAMALVDELEACGAIVLGPASTVDMAIAAIEQDLPAAAVLDVELQGDMVTPVADLLTQRGVPYVLTTGHDAEALPASFRQMPRCTKPTPAMQVLQTLCATLKVA